MKLPILLTILTATALCAAIPLQLEKPDGKPADLTKPIKVYVLAGQSNMVGMGNLKGARPQYPSIYLSADPAIIEGRMHAGTHRSKGACKWYWKSNPGLKKHGLYDDADGKSPIVPTGTVKAGKTKLFIDVPAKGNYLVHVGYGESSNAAATLNGQEVYKKAAGVDAVRTKIALEPGKRYPLEINYATGGSAALWLEQVDLTGRGDLITLTGKDGKFSYLVDKETENGWATRKDVFFHDGRIPNKKGSFLNAASNGGSLGPEVGFGIVMGMHHGEQVLLIKTAMGNRSLKFDFQPPSSKRTDPENKYEGLEYRLMVEGVTKTLANLKEIVPDYNDQGYEIVGFGWFQGHKDRGSSKKEYEGHLVNLINDLRKDLKAPTMKAVIATAGFGGYRINSGDWNGVWEAQMAVGDPKQHPKFAGNVASVDTRDFWREIEESPKSEDYHYHRNPEFYLLCGEAMGRAMVRMLGGKAAVMPKSGREAITLAAMEKEAATPAPTPEQIAASQAASKAMVLDGLMQSYITNERNQAKLAGAFDTSTAKPKKFPDYLEGPLDDVVAFYEAAGIDTYSWKPVLADMHKAEWEIFSFNAATNPYEAPAPAKNELPKDAPVEIKLPAGQENWFTKDFDTKKAGWKIAPAPFGKTVPADWPEHIAWMPVRYPWMYPAERPQPTTVVKESVLLMRQTFDLPPAKPGHRYRVLISGSINANSGEGFSIYANGKPLGERKSGVVGFRRQGKSGSLVWSESMADFKGGPVTLAIANFPMSNFKPGSSLPAIGPLSVSIQSQKIPDVNDRP